jgi:hypothetical protein
MARIKKKILSDKMSITEKIIFIHEEMKVLVIKAGIQEPKYLFMIKNLEKRSVEYHEILLNWLKSFKDNEFKAVKIIWNQMPDHFWENHKFLFNTENLPEQAILKDKFKSLREAFFKYPRSKKIRVRKKVKMEK